MDGLGGKEDWMVALLGARASMYVLSTDQCISTCTNDTTSDHKPFPKRILAAILNNKKESHVHA